jgi:hypothetical protein
VDRPGLPCLDIYIDPDQGNFLAINSDPTTVGRNAGIFWALYQMSGVLGNAFVLVLFRSVEVIDPDTRWAVAWALTAMCLAGQLLVLLLRPTPWVGQGRGTTGVRYCCHVSPLGKSNNPWQGILSCLRLLRTPDMLLLCCSFVYSGLETSFWAGSFPSSISFSLQLGPARKAVMGLGSIMVPLGSILAGGGLVLARARVHRAGRQPVILAGLALHTVAFLLCLLFLPHLAPLGDTAEPALLHPRWVE